MIQASDITVAVSCIFNDLDPIWMCAHTAKRFGITLHPYGMGETYRGWVDIKIIQYYQEVLNCKTSHILYTDARDAWFCCGLDEIAAKYNAMGCPPLLQSAQPDIFGSYGKYYEGIPWDLSKPFRYTGVGGTLCEVKALLEAFQWMLMNYHVGEDEGGLPNDDVPFWLEFMRHHPGALKFDHECAIFMNAGSAIEQGMWNILEIKEGRVFNKLTGEWPAIIHFNGGSSDAVKGKWDNLEQYWTAFGYTERPPWERP